MRKLILLPCVALLAAATPANSAPPPIASQVAAPSDSQQPASLNGGKAAQPAQEKKICKQLPTSGTRLPNRACLTEKEWKQVEAEVSGQ